MLYMHASYDVNLNECECVVKRSVHTNQFFPEAEWILFYRVHYC